MQQLIALIPCLTPGYTPYTGSIQIAADCCGELCWMGPKQQEKHKEGHKTVCPICLYKLTDGVLPEVKCLGNTEKVDVDPKQMASDYLEEYRNRKLRSNLWLLKAMAAILRTAPPMVSASCSPQVAIAARPSGQPGS